jgi:transcription elongation factor GreA
MPSKKNPNSAQPHISLGESATRFLTTGSSDKASSAHQEVFKFIRWFGEDRKLSSVTGQEIINYSEQTHASTSKSDEHLNVIKSYLKYVHKEGYTAINLSIHVKIRKTSGKISATGTANLDEPVLMTSQGFEEGREKLMHLQTERPRIADEIRRAAADKDFRENAPLHAAREQMSLLDGQIKELEDALRRAKVVEKDHAKGHLVAIGDTVVIEDQTSKEHISYSLVSSREANVKHGKISIVSPLGQALLNKEVGQSISVNAPSGLIQYRIIEIKQIQR